MVTRRYAYYAFWLPVVAAVLVLEVAWRMMLVDALIGLRERRR